MLIELLPNEEFEENLPEVKTLIVFDSHSPLRNNGV
jgi:hypothetical protein